MSFRVRHIAAVLLWLGGIIAGFVWSPPVPILFFTVPACMAGAYVGCNLTRFVWADEDRPGRAAADFEEFRQQMLGIARGEGPARDEEAINQLRTDPEGYFRDRR